MTPTRIIIDTDPGVDDALTFLLALASPEIQLEALTTVMRQYRHRQNHAQRAGCPGTCTREPYSCCARMFASAGQCAFSNRQKQSTAQAELEKLFCQSRSHNPLISTP